MVVLWVPFCQVSFWYALGGCVLLPYGACAKFGAMRRKLWKNASKVWTVLTFCHFSIGSHDDMGEWQDRGFGFLPTFSCILSPGRRLWTQACSTPSRTTTRTLVNTTAHGGVKDGTLLVSIWLLSIAMANGLTADNGRALLMGSFSPKLLFTVNRSVSQWNA